VDVVKMDVEGAEHRVVSGGKELLRKHHPTLLTEFSPGGLGNVSRVSGEAFLQSLFDLGYHISVIELDGDVTACGRDIPKVLARFREASTDHIDLLAVAH
jgi:hypothetical protein